jgi:hypothetical protein
MWIGGYQFIFTAKASAHKKWDKRPESPVELGACAGG